MDSAFTTYFRKGRRVGRRIYKSLFFPPAVIFAAILLVTYWSFLASKQSINRDQSIAITNDQDVVTSTINQRLSTYEEILVGGSGLFRASRDVTEKEWHDYISTYDVSNRYPGVQAIGYIKVVNGQQLPELVEYMRGQGFANFNVRPQGQRDTYTAILYIEPGRQSPVIGLDLFTEADRKQTMESARDGGVAVVTPPLKSVQGTTNQPVFSMFVPQYQQGMPIGTVAQRQAALRGYIYAGFRSDDFFNKLLPANLDAKNFGFRVSSTVNGKSVTFYETPNYGITVNGRGAVKDSQNLSLYGQTWKIDYAFNSDGLATSRRKNAPFWTIVAGSIFAILLAEVIYLLLKSRAQELNRQRDRAVDLAKDELLSLASHQLRTPATTVKQYLGMVLQGFAGDISKPQTTLLEKAYSGNERQLFIINEMLHVAKIDSGRITLAKQRTNLNELLTTITSDIQSDAKAAGHTVRLKLPKKTIWMSLDEHMLRMAIENLLSNALKYMLNKGTVDLSLKHSAQTITIAVKDTGVGIDPKDFPKLYKLFSRLNNKLTQTVSGTGVGLYLAKHLVELHNGHIELESKPGKGSTFRIILPEKSGKQP